MTPLSRNIYQIKAFRYFSLVKNAEDELSMIAGVLKGKYSKATARSIPMNRRGSNVRNEKGITFERNGNSVHLLVRTGRDAANVDNLVGAMVYPRVIITCRSKEYKLRDKEYAEIHKQKEEQKGFSSKERIKEAEAVL